jgi:hypothetical protein
MREDESSVRIPSELQEKVKRYMEIGDCNRDQLIKHALNTFFEFVEEPNFKPGTMFAKRLKRKQGNEIHEQTETHREENSRSDSKTKKTEKTSPSLTEEPTATPEESEIETHNGEPALTPGLCTKTNLTEEEVVDFMNTIPLANKMATDLELKGICSFCTIEKHTYLQLARLKGFDQNIVKALFKKLNDEGYRNANMERTHEKLKDAKLLKMPKRR